MPQLFFFCDEQRITDHAISYYTGIERLPGDAVALKPLYSQHSPSVSCGCYITGVERFATTDQDRLLSTKYFGKTQ